MRGERRREISRDEKSHCWLCLCSNSCTPPWPTLQRLPFVRAKFSGSACSQHPFIKRDKCLPRVKGTLPLHTGAHKGLAGAPSLVRCFPGDTDGIQALGPWTLVFWGCPSLAHFPDFFSSKRALQKTWDWRFLLKAALFSSVYSSVAIYFTKNSCSEQSGSAVAWYKGILFKTKPLQQIGLKYQNIQIFMCVSNKQYNVSYILL